MLASSCSSGHGSSPGCSPKETPHRTLHGLPITSKNTFLQCELPSDDSGSEDVVRISSRAARRRVRSAPPSVSGSSTCANDSSSRTGGTPFENTADRQGTPSFFRSEGCTPSFFRSEGCDDDDCEDTGAPVCEEGEGEGTTGSTTPGSASRRKRNLGKCKRERIKFYEVQMKGLIVEHPRLDLDAFIYPPFLSVFPGVLDRFKERLREFQQSVLAGANPDPSYRHPSLRSDPKAASGSSSPRKGRRVRHMQSL